MPDSRFYQMWPTLVRAKTYMLAPATQTYRRSIDNGSTGIGRNTNCNNRGTSWRLP